MLLREWGTLGYRGLVGGHGTVEGTRVLVRLRQGTVGLGNRAVIHHVARVIVAWQPT